MNITGTFGTGDSTPSLYRDDTSGAFYNSGTNGHRFANGNTHDDRTSEITLDASRNWSGATSSNGSHAHTIGSTGKGTAFDVMPPYIVAYVWRRTA